MWGETSYETGAQLPERAAFHARCREHIGLMLSAATVSPHSAECTSPMGYRYEMKLPGWEWKFETLEGSFSAVSTPTFAKQCSVESS